MRNKILLILTFAFLVSLCGCASGEIADTRVQITLVETDGCTVENNGLWVTPGEDAVFLLTMAEGSSLADTDYEGDFSTRLVDGKLELTLEDIRYPVRVHMTLTNQYCTITYDPNGGDGEQTVITYDKTNHLRPNTAIGTDLFSRSGYTLTGWNTEPDGSGQRIGLGSRVTVDGALTLYAQWARWTDASQFRYTLTQFGNISINAYLGSDETVAVPGYIDGYPVTAIMAGAFEGSTVRHLILPTPMDRLAPSAFTDSSLETVTMYDNIQMVSDDCFEGCENLKTLYINAIEAPWGYDFRKESVYADKVDLLMAAQGQKKMVFYGGCSVWYNLDGAAAHEAFGEEYTIVNMGLNGTVNSTVQMQILGHFLEDGDVLLHTLELASEPQLLIDPSMGDKDDKLWCGLEYNYDLFTLVDLRTVTGEFDSLCSYLDKKDSETDYHDIYRDSADRKYLDEYGCVPFARTQTRDVLSDRVLLDPTYVTQEGMDRLEAFYSHWQDLGVTVYVSYACVNMDEVPEDQRGNVERMDTLVKDAVGAMDGPVVISTLSDFLFVREDFYDTHYHLLTAQVQANTAVWLRDLRAQMVLDGLWEAAE